MTVSIEGYLAINLTADFALLAAVSRAMGLFSWRGVLAGDGVCAAFAVLAVACPGLRTFAALASPAAAALVITRRAAPRLWAIFTLTLFAQALLCAGLARLLPPAAPWAAPTCLGLGALITLAVNVGRPAGSGDWQVALCLASGGRQVRFSALIDTGNRLREPLSGLPVLIAEAALVRDILPGTGYRTLVYGAIGSDGQMACFRPDALWICRGGRKRQGPEVWVAVSPEPLPGLCQALAPPVFASYY